MVGHPDPNRLTLYGHLFGQPNNCPRRTSRLSAP